MNRVKVLLTGSTWALVVDDGVTYRVDVTGEVRDVSTTVHMMGVPTQAPALNLEDEAPYPAVRAEIERDARAALGVRLVEILLAPDLSRFVRDGAANELEGLLATFPRWRSALSIWRIAQLGAVLNADGRRLIAGDAPPPVDLAERPRVRALLESFPAACSALPRSHAG
jgi:hypothetical protein